MLLDPPNLLRRAAVALAVGVGIAELKPVPLVELAEEAEGATEGRAVLPTCTHTQSHIHSMPCRRLLFVPAMAEVSVSDRHCELHGHVCRVADCQREGGGKGGGGTKRIWLSTPCKDGW